MGTHGPTTVEAETAKGCKKSPRAARPMAEFRRNLSVFTILIIIAIDGVAGVRGVVAVVINPAQIHMAVHKADHTLSITIERAVIPTRFASMP
jgi:hypothetical protein